MVVWRLKWASGRALQQVRNGSDSTKLILRTTRPLLPSSPTCERTWISDAPGPNRANLTARQNVSSELEAGVASPGSAGKPKRWSRACGELRTAVCVATQNNED